MNNAGFSAVVNSSNATCMTLVLSTNDLVTVGPVGNPTACIATANAAGCHVNPTLYDRAVLPPPPPSTAFPISPTSSSVPLIGARDLGALAIALVMIALTYARGTGRASRARNG